jgi:hypothetical protein
LDERHYEFEWDEVKAAANVQKHGLSFDLAATVFNDPRLPGEPVDDDKMPAEIDFSKGVRGLHHIPAGAKVFMPASIEQSVWLYYSNKAEAKGIDLSELLTDVLKRHIEIGEALK